MTRSDTLDRTQKRLLRELGKLDEKTRLKRMRELIHFLLFEERWSTLTPEEIIHMEQPQLSDGARHRLQAAKTEDELNRLIEMYARSHYFRRCAWRDYLNGRTNQKPFDSTKDQAA